MTDCITPWMLVLNFFQSHTCGELYFAGLPADSFTFVEYLPYFLKTYILEFPLYYLLLKNIKNFKQLLAINLILNIATHPMVFFGFPYLLAFFDADYRTYLVVAEIFAPLTEALVLILVYKISWARAFTVATIANLISWGIGVYWI